VVANDARHRGYYHRNRYPSLNGIGFAFAFALLGAINRKEVAVKAQFCRVAVLPHRAVIPVIDGPKPACGRQGRNLAG